MMGFISRRSLDVTPQQLATTARTARTAARTRNPASMVTRHARLAAGMTDHVWTTAALFSYRVPAEFIDQLPKLEQVFPDFAPIYHSS